LYYIYNHNFLTIELPSKLVDLIVTSPPYNLDMSYGDYDDSDFYVKYLVFIEEFFKKSFDLLKSDGRMCVNIPLDTNKNGYQSIYADIVNIAKRIGFKYQTTIIWDKQITNRQNSWGLWLSASAPFVISPVETILVLYKNTWKKFSGSKISDISKQEFLSWISGLWAFTGESKKKIKHPAPFPIELPKRCIKLFSYVNDIILDPFLGSGTTLLACIETNRKGVGIELDKNYCDLSKERIIKLLY
jgi:site-specific DNA-methyltransferase (adenine-specific)